MAARIVGARYILEPGYPGDRETEGYITVWEKGTGFFGFVQREGKREVPESLWMRIRTIGADRFVERVMAGGFEHVGMVLWVCANDPDREALAELSAFVQYDPEGFAREMEDIREGIGRQLPLALWDEDELPF